MSTSILSTKLYFPSYSHNLVPRPRLVEALQAGLQKALILISAPAGYGKTTLLSEWHARFGSGFPVAWLSLDPDDDNLPRFLTYLTATLQTVLPGAALNSTQPLRLSDLEAVEELLIELINRVNTSTQDFALILDDYHVITDPEIHKTLAYLLDHQPVKMHLVLLTRSDPPFLLAKLRARSQMVELRADDLRFTREETQDFVNSMMNLDLSAINIDTLTQITEGWIAGLQMAALSLRGREDISEFINAFSGSHRYILDYFAEEVLQRQPESIQSFLIKTSILDRLNGSLCDAVLDKPGDSTQLLIDLERKNLFIIPLDDERNWYRYHHLFSDLLFLRLKQTQPDVIRMLYECAAGWFKQSGDLETALGYALKAQDYELVAQLIVQVKEKLWGYGNVAIMLKGIQSLPEEMLRSQPEFCISYAAGLTVSGYYDQAEKWLSMVVDQLKSVVVPDQRESTMQAEIGLYRSVRARFHGDFSNAIHLSQAALDQIPSDNIRLKGIGLLFLGHAHFYAGHMEIAGQVLQEAIQTNQASGHLAAYLNACHHLAQLRELQGQLNRANEIYESAWRVVKQQPHPVYAGIELAGLGDLNREWNQLDEAENLIDQGLGLAEIGDDIFFLRDCYIASIRLALAQKKWEAASHYIQRAEQVIQRCPTSCDIAYLHAWQARLHLAQGNLVAAERCLENKAPESIEAFDFQGEFVALTQVRIWLAQQKLDQAASLLERLQIEAKNAGRYGRLLEIQMLLALGEQAAGKEKGAVERLSRVLAQAEPEGYVRLFIDEGVSMAKLLYKVSALLPSKMHAYADRLLATYYREEAVPSNESQNRLLIEPLSEREIEVLRMVAAGKANKEIADELFLAVGTVKKHLNTIFGKLNVSSRTQAIARGRELDLL